MIDIKLSDRLFNYIHNEVSGDFCGFCIQEAIEKDHSWLKSQNRYKEEKIQALESELNNVKNLNDSKSETIQKLESEIKKRDELLKRAEQIIRDLDNRYFEDNLDFLEEIEAILEE